VLTEQVGGSIVIASGGGADHFDVMTFPVHLPNADAIPDRRRFGQGVEIRDRETERRVDCKRVIERRYRFGRLRSLLRLTIEGGSPNTCRDRPTVILDRWTSGRKRLDAEGVGPFSVTMHDYQDAPVA
jgi:hypothetical protein